MCIYIYILFGIVKPESEIIPSGQKSFNYEHLNFPSKELNVTDITEQNNVTVFCFSLRE